MLKDTIRYFFTGSNWMGHSGILMRIGEHLYYSGLSVFIAALIAVPVGVYIGHTGRGAMLAVGTVNVLRALPSLGLMTLLVLLLGLGLIPSIAALVVLAVPPILATVHAGMRNVDRTTVDAARAMGMQERQIILRVEIPIAMPLIVSGVRNAMLQVIATATIAAYVNLGGIGRYIFDGLAVYDYSEVLVGAFLVMVRAIAVDAALGVVQRLVYPGGIRALRTASAAARDK